MTHHLYLANVRPSQVGYGPLLQQFVRSTKLNKPAKSVHRLLQFIL